MLQKDTSTLHDFSAACACEWLETNGLGGWSSSSVIGCNTRRYHGLLIAATVPPAERMALVSKMDETIICGDEKHELGTNNYGQCVHPAGYTYLTAFNKGLFPQFTYAAAGIILQKTIGMVHGENTVFIIYDVIKAGGPFTLELLPLLSVRNYHGMVHANNAINREASFEQPVFKLKAYEGTPVIFIKVPGAAYHAAPDWYYHFNYSAEQYRGLDFVEDLFTPGKFTVELKEADSFGIILSTEDPANKDAQVLFEAEKNRKTALLKDQPADEIFQQLVLAADQFIVKRTVTGNAALAAGATVIAGYHWFTDWGRDTMISLPGLTLATGRYEDAKKILTAFAGSVSMGMLPNRFQDNGAAPEYNTADATLWYFIAVHKYVQATHDINFVLQDILSVLKDIINWHYKGTRYNIHATADGLLSAGETGQQLTWMDAKVGGWVVTPRMGKPVEIQALWYNALKIFAELLQHNNQPEDAAIINIRAEKAKKNFVDLFWYTAGNYLYDCIDEHGIANAELRPNQLFAISLPFTLIDIEKSKAVLRLVTEKLYTPVGLKSLAASDAHYVPVYGGDQWHRDAAYHQGTVWSWLLGPYIDAIIKVNTETGKAEARKIIDRFVYHLNEAGIGTVSEIFDAAAPHQPRGCIAQAWGVAEVLRVIKDYLLLILLFYPFNHF